MKAKRTKGVIVIMKSGLTARFPDSDISTVIELVTNAPRGHRWITVFKDADKRNPGVFLRIDSIDGAYESDS